MTEVQNNLIFVYGSLKRGFALHSCLYDQQFLGEAETRPNYRLFDCGNYPGLVKVASGGVSVKGEVFQVTAGCLATLDKVEAVDDGLYVRDIIELSAPFTQNSVEAYFFAGPTSQLPDCGDRWPADNRGVQGKYHA